MKKLIFCAALFALITFAACSDDDDESNLPVTEANIVGTWQIVNEQGYDGGTWSDDYPLLDDVNHWWYWTYTFDEGGTGTLTDIDIIDKVEYADSWKLNYSISGNTLTITIWFDDDDDEERSYQIKSLTKSQLVLFERDDDQDDGSYHSETFKRIK